MMPVTPVIAGLALFGVLACALCARSFIAFVTVREDRPSGTYDAALVAVAWVTVLAIIGIAAILCVTIGYLGSKL